MRKEIGSEFWDIPVSSERNNIFDNVTWFISGRAAFRAILQQIKIQRCGYQSIKVALPSYLCESMILPLEKEGIEYKFYPVELRNGIFQYDYSNIEDCNVVLVIDYFGYESTNNNFPSLGKIIIRDLTHSIFTKKYDDADYYFGSLRKWAGFKCGGFAFKRNGKMIEPTDTSDDYFALRYKAMSLKERYINGEEDGKNYLKVFTQAEELLNDCAISRSTLSDISNAFHLDVNFIKSVRRRNAQTLVNGLKDYCLINWLGKNDCPLFVPIFYKNRDTLRKFLIEKEIYCPVHWPKPFKKTGLSDLLYEQELSLVCDQRYSVDDMKRIVEAVKEFIKSEQNA